jgi:hypothetical protein
MERNTQWSRGALALALITLAIVAIGCGGQKQARTSSNASTGQEAVAASAAGPMAPPYSAPLEVGRSQAVYGPEVAPASSDSLPPDVAASITESLIAPGTVIEVTAKGSPDVEEVLLSDGLGKPQRFAYDSAADLWRASYRVPVRIRGERLGLSVTAKNDIGRWRRVWVFVGPKTEAAKDTVQVEEK